MAGSSTASSGGIGFFGALALLFIALKLGGVIGWSWWWVLAPMWLPAAAFVVVVATLCFVAAVGGRGPFAKR